MLTTPTAARPGSEEKIAVMARRYAAIEAAPKSQRQDLSVFHPADAAGPPLPPPDDAPADLPAGVTYANGRYRVRIRHDGEVVIDSYYPDRASAESVAAMAKRVIAKKVGPRPCPCGGTWVSVRGIIRCGTCRMLRAE